MKKFLLLCAFAAGFAGVANAESEIIEGFYATAISDNGQWVVGQADDAGLIVVKDLLNNKVYVTSTTQSAGMGYVTAVGKAIANDGTVAALFDGLPYSWVPEGTNGKWTRLPGLYQDGSAMLGSISADGSMIVGGIGESGLSTDGHQMTYPCFWKRQANGTYAAPVNLPNPGKDPFGYTPQLMQCIAVSQDGKVITALMTESSGYYQIPFLYTQNEDGDWTYKDLGSSLLNPQGRIFPGYAGDFNLVQPNPYDYLNEAQEKAFWNAFSSWARQEPQASLKDEDFTMAQFEFMATFMNEDDSKEFLSQLEEYVKAKDEYNKKLDDIISFRETIREEGINFVMNNSRVSPDGKYAYFTGEKTVVNDSEYGFGNIHAPVRFEVATGEYQTYDFGINMVLTSVSSDYSILCRIVGADDFSPSEGWIYPQGQTEGMTIPEFIRAQGTPAAYEWMEEEMYKEIIVGVTDSGAFQYDDTFAVGLPYCSADLSKIACANSTMYWNDSYYTQFSYISFILETGIVDDSGVDNVADASEASISILPGGYIEIKGDAAAITVYNLSGSVVYRSDSPSGVVSTGLSNGVYVISLTTASGNRVTRKAIL